MIGVEPPDEPRPWDVLLLIAAGNDAWRHLAHPATVDVFDRYRLDADIQRCVNDPVVGDDGGLTTTRDCKTYADAFETAADRKWQQIKDFVRPGRILDIGCATGATVQLVDADPRFDESDLIGVEVARHTYAECVHKKPSACTRRSKGSSTTRTCTSTSAKCPAPRSSRRARSTPP